MATGVSSQRVVEHGAIESATSAVLEWAFIGSEFAEAGKMARNRFEALLPGLTNDGRNGVTEKLASHLKPLFSLSCRHQPYNPAALRSTQKEVLDAYLTFYQVPDRLWTDLNRIQRILKSESALYSAQDRAIIGAFLVDNEKAAFERTMKEITSACTPILQTTPVAEATRWIKNWYTFVDMVSHVGDVYYSKFREDLERLDVTDRDLLKSLVPMRDRRVLQREMDQCPKVGISNNTNFIMAEQNFKAWLKVIRRHRDQIERAEIAMDHWVKQITPAELDAIFATLNISRAMFDERPDSQYLKKRFENNSPNLDDTTHSKKGDDMSVTATSSSTTVTSVVPSAPTGPTPVAVPQQQSAPPPQQKVGGGVPLQAGIISPSSHAAPVQPSWWAKTFCCARSVPSEPEQSAPVKKPAAQQPPATTGEGKGASTTPPQAPKVSSQVSRAVAAQMGLLSAMAAEAKALQEKDSSLGDAGAASRYEAAIAATAAARAYAAKYDTLSEADKAEVAKRVAQLTTKA